MRRTLTLAVGLIILILPRPIAAQGDINRQIRENQARLDSIRGERDRLEDQLTRLRGRIRNIASELSNIERQKSATSRIVNELDRQMADLTAQLDTITLDLLLTRDALAEKRAVRQRRVVEIYKRGPLWGFQVLLAAESFADLLSRSKYLFLVSQQDQALEVEVENLRDRIARERRVLATVRLELKSNRDERGRELTRYQRLEQQRQRNLRRTRSTAARASERITTLETAEGQLAGLIGNLERRRREDIAAGRLAPTGSITPADIRSLPWPVDGPIIYRYGRATGPDNTVIRYNGIGIRAAVGTPVRAVADGQVFFAGPYGTYGPSIMLDHGGGYYTLYLYLSRIGVRDNQFVATGDTIGESGGRASDEGPHFEFQIREHQGGGHTLPLDPLNWLKRRNE
ncbi:MAG: peptidoglycan DD-metalloendopeptidase family protein [Gemmatimonadetes bacterium]|nr:peptidoglycan DD-metalloendopeptidase family protein [Gemmatimonadota bacterium]